MAKIHEVAEAAGVSISTVSYALSGKRPVAPETRRRIEEVARTLGYEPNAGARMLAGSRTHIFALTEPLRADTHAPTHMAFVLATAVAARKRDYDILLLTDEQASAGMRRVAASDLVDAVLVLDVAPDDERVAIARSIDIPTVFIGIPNDSEGLVCVDLDFEAAARMAVDRVADAGHRRIAMIGQPAVAYRRSNFPPRVRGAYESHAAARGLDFSFATSGEIAMDAATSRQAVAAALDAGATALLLHGADDLHLLVLTELAARGLEVGVDVSVLSVATSFDTTLLPTALDTIPLVPQTSCELAVHLAVQALGPDRLAPGVHLIPPTYVAVGSVAAPLLLSAAE
jgi:DNA-binding LacI/PurR family transcriptional regulator